MSDLTLIVAHGHLGPIQSHRVTTSHKLGIAKALRGKTFLMWLCIPWKEWAAILRLTQAMLPSWGFSQFTPQNHFQLLEHGTGGAGHVISS
jgi:hypothetical protein